MEFEMAQQLRTFVVLPENPVSIASHSHCNSSPNALFWPLRALHFCVVQPYVHIYSEYDDSKE